MRIFMLPVLAGLVLTGCSREEIETYEVPSKEEPAAPAPTVTMGGTSADNEAVIQAHNAMMQQMPTRGFSAYLPDAWTEKGASGMRMASYVIGGTSIDFYLISLTMGDVESNVARWCRQVEMPDALPEVLKQVESISVDGHPSAYVEIYNESGGKGIIAAIIDLAPNYWYFTAKGSVDELKAHAADIRAFIESIKIE